MVQCAIEGCSSRSDTQPSAFTENAVHFHRVPVATLIRQKWLQAINKREVKASTRVCSLHFKKENYYQTRKGFNRLTGSSVPEIKLHVEAVKDDTTGSNSDEEKSNVQLLEQNIIYRSQSQQNSTNVIPQKIGKTDNVLGTTKYIKHEEEDDTTDFSEDENMSNLQRQQPNINIPNQCQENNSKEITTNNLKGSSTLKPGVQKHKVRTLLERKLLKEVRRLQEQGKKRMEAISCLIEQNRRLLHRNSFLEQELKNNKNP